MSHYLKLWFPKAHSYESFWANNQKGLKELARKKQSLLNGALVLVVAMAITKVIGAIYKIPLTSILETVGRGYYSTAYNLFIPVYSIALAGLPVAISKTVSHYAALGRYRDVRRVFKVCQRLFLITGIVGTLVILFVAYPYAYSIKRTEAIYALLIVAPSIFFCCLMSSYRGYYNGLRNMTPSAVSEVVEALGKMCIGLALSYGITKYGLTKAVPGNTVFGLVVTEATEHEEIMLAIYPFAAAGAIAGVTLGTVLATVYLMLRHKIGGDGITVQDLRTAPAPDSPKDIRKALMAIAVPVVASTLIFNITNLIDSWSIQNRLDAAIAGGLDVVKNMYMPSFIEAGYIDKPEVWSKYLYGAYEIAVDFKNMIPTLTTVLGISAIPVLSEAWTLKQKPVIKSSIESVIRMCMLISMPAGFGMAVLAKQILTIMYHGKEAMTSVQISSAVMVAYGFTVFIIAVSQPLTSMLQTLGRTDIPVKSIAVGAVLKVVVNFILIGIPQINIYGAIIGTVLCYLVSCLINYIWLIKISEVKVSLKSTFVKPLFCSVLCAVGAWSSHALLNKLFLRVPFLADGGRLSADTLAALVAICIAVVVYVISLLCTGAIVEDDVKMLPKGEKIAKVLAKFGFLG